MKRAMTAVVAGVALAGIIGVGVATASETGPGARMADALSALVGKGTITQDQADAVTKALDDARTDARADREADRAARQAELDTLLTDTLGMDLTAVREKLAGGATLREVAGNNADELAAALLDRLDTRLKAAVTDGRITQEQATATLDRAKSQADAWLAGDDSALGGRGLAGLLGGGMAGAHMGGRGMGGEEMSGRGGGFGPGHGAGGPMGHGWSDEDSSADQAPTAPTAGTAASWRI